MGRSLFLNTPKLAKNMRATIMIVSLAFLYATSANDDVVPEDNMYAMDDDLSEAHATVQEMLASGRSDKECRELVRVAKEEVKTLVKTCQDTINKLPTGQHCMDLGGSLVRKAKEEKAKADKHYATCSTELTNSMNAKVNFGSRTYSSLTVGKCDTFYSHSSYVNAKMRFDAATSSKTQASGAAAQSKKDLEAVTASHKKQVQPTTRRTRLPGTRLTRSSVCLTAKPSAPSLAHLAAMLRHCRLLQPPRSAKPFLRSPCIMPRSGSSHMVDLDHICLTQCRTLYMYVQGE